MQRTNAFGAAELQPAEASLVPIAFAAIARLS
jgi:hypothetical protein